jgi:hypothetical protein
MAASSPTKPLSVPEGRERVAMSLCNDAGSSSFVLKEQK